MEQKLSITKSKFIKVRCSGCKNEQIIFGRASSEIKCVICGQVLSEPSGGKGKIKGRILEFLS
ncbi:MAG: 30S ribosomal protein S27e [archaeon]